MTIVSPLIVHLSLSAAFPYSVIASLGCTDAESGTTLTYALTQSPGSLFSVVAGGIKLNSKLLLSKVTETL